jgi:penicillin-binding protein 2
MPSSRKPLRYDGVEWRIHFVGLMLAVAFSVLCIQFWRLQIVDMAKFSSMSETNRVWPKRLKGDRGIIYGRNDVVLADNRASADIVFVPGDCPQKQMEDVCHTLETLIDVPPAELLDKIKANKSEPFTQIIVKRDVDKAERVRVEERSFRLPGVFTVVHPQRRYLYGKVGGQILGYLNEISDKELARGKEQGYTPGDLVGRDGLEATYEPQLHGHDGYMNVTKYAAGRPQLRTDFHGIPFIAERDSLGNILAEEGQRRDPLPGDPLRLTLDIDLQSYCETLLSGEVGAITVLDAESGAVLALASNPNYDPSVFVTRGNKEERAELLLGTKPNRMMNRNYQENYPPGSIYKVMLASAALSEGVITPTTTFFCPGHFQINGQGNTWNCWQKGGHGTVNVVDALRCSCDVFFYNVGLKLGIDKMSEWSHKMGLGQRTGVDLPGEVPGLSPDRLWKAKLYASKPVWEQNWYPGDTVNVSIGQGSNSTTPLQNAVLMACIVNGGHCVRPYLNAALGPKRSERFIPDAALQTVVEGMRKCVEEKNGTGHRVYTPGMTILGKTGSAQIMSLKFHEQFGKNEANIPKEMRDHAWFVCGVLDREPKIAMCVLIEHGHHGGGVASPVAKKVLDYFYGRDANAPVTPEKLALRSAEAAHEGIQ